MKTMLMPTQLQDIERLLQVSDLPNHSLPGTGKTLTTIGAIARMGFQSGLIVGPVVSLAMWKRELEKELGCVAKVVTSSTKKLDPKADFHIASYGSAHKLLAMLSPSLGTTTTKQKLGALVLDESHYLKNPDSARTIAAFGPTSDGSGGLFEYTDYCFTLTGTPIERYYNDLWSQLRAVQPELLHKNGVLEYGDFCDRFTYSAMKSFHPRMRPVRTITGSRRGEELNDILNKQLGVIRRTIADVDAYMPETTFRIVNVEPEPNAELQRLLKGKKAEDVAALLDKGDIAMATACRLVGESKVNAVVDYAASLVDGDNPMLIAYVHTEVGRRIARLLTYAGLRVARISGETSNNDRAKIEAAFNSGELDVIVGQIMAAGVSLNLQKRCRNVLVAELSWSPSLIAQFFKRVARLGQKRHTQVDYMVVNENHYSAVVDAAYQLVLKTKSRLAAIATGYDEEIGL